jgi:thiosulfate dehydrogenase [quinone] large subunit
MTLPVNTHDIGPALGLLSIRIWLGLRGILTGIEKFAGTKTSDAAVVIEGQPNTYGLTDTATQKFYAFSNYHGIPPGLRTQFAAEPLLPPFALDLYDKVLGPALIILGVTVLLGILPRISLFLTALLYTSLTAGLILIKQDSGVAWLVAHITPVALALIFADRDRFTLLGRKW